MVLVLFVCAVTAWVIFDAIVYCLFGAWAGCVGALPVTEVVAAARIFCLLPQGLGFYLFGFVFCIVLVLLGALTFLQVIAYRTLVVFIGTVWW